MADQTQGAVDSLVGLLSAAIKDEAKLLGGVHGDMQFIKDEMESMNGFLLHVTKTDMHDDQLRAWMKQVRDIAYIAQDCIELYRRDFSGPPDKGLRALLCYLPMLLRSLPARHRLANKIRELKVRVHDVGERRQRYDISIPKADAALKTPPDDQASQDEIDEAREEFVRALAHDKEKQQEALSFDHAIRILAEDLRCAATTVRAGLANFSLLDHEATTRTRTVCMDMLLRALRAHSQVRRTAKTKEELEKLVEGTDSKDLPTQVMVFCYSKLSRSYKSCLQYLYAFHDEDAISRTSLVRRWLAEGLVEKQAHGSLEEAAELCFKELLFRGFLFPHDLPGTAGKVKRCKIDETVWAFVHHMSRTENFESNLPFHLSNQLSIRGFVKQREEQLKKQHENPPPQSICLCGPMRRRPRDDNMPPDPMDEMVKFLKALPKTYRLNVLDLGGCRGLNKSHLKSICKVLWLKYLSLRDTTGVSRLPKQINNLRLLETLDIRQSEVRPDDTRHICLLKLKHLLASPTKDGDAWMPRRIGVMRNMEILSRVRVQHGGAAAKQELEEVERLPQLRKLGVVLGGSEVQDNMKNLLRAITRLSECLRSLSVWITPPPTNGDPTVDMQMTHEHSAPKSLQILHISGLRKHVLPGWIQELKQLSEITLCDTSLSKQNLQDLGKNLHRLRCLRLRRISYTDFNKLIFSKDGFQDLGFLVVEGDNITTIDFEEDGAAPKLKKIVWYNIPVKQEGTLSGYHRLLRLEKVELKGHFSNISSIKASIGSKLVYEYELYVE